MLETVWAAGMPLFRHRAALRPRAVRNAAQRIPRPKPRNSYPDLNKGRPLAGAVQAGGALAADGGAFFETPSRRERFDYSYDGVKRSLEFSLERLGLDEIDIVYVHDVDVIHPWQPGGRRRAHQGIHDGRLSRARRIARIGRDQGDRRRNQRMGDRRETGASRRFRPVSAGRTLHAARAGRADELPAVVLGKGHWRRRRRAVQLRAFWRPA